MSFAILSFVGLMLIVKTLHFIALALLVGSTYAMSTDPTSVSKLKLMIGSAVLSLVTSAAYLAGYYDLSYFSSWGLSLFLELGLIAAILLNVMLIIKPASASGNLNRVKEISSLNFALAIPIFFFAEMATHMGMDINAEAPRIIVIAALAVPIVLVEAFALVGKGPQVANLKTAIPVGIVLTVILYSIMELATKLA